MLYNGSMDNASQDSLSPKQLAHEILHVDASSGEKYTFLIALVNQAVEGETASKTDAPASDDRDHIVSYQKALKQFTNAMRNLAFEDNYQLTKTDRLVLAQYPAILSFLQDQWQTEQEAPKLTKDSLSDNPRVANLMKAMMSLAPGMSEEDVIDRINNISTCKYLMAEKIDTDIRPKMATLCRMLGIEPLPERGRAS